MPQDRSPVSPKALVLSELRALPVGTRLVLFDGYTLEKEQVTYMGVEDARFGVFVRLAWSDGTTGEVPAYNLGLEPSRIGCAGWDVLSVLVLPEHVHTLPTQPIARRTIDE